MLNFPTKQINSLKKYLQREKKAVDKNLKEVEEDDPALSPSLAETSEPGTDSYIADSHTKNLVLGMQLKKTGNSIKNALLRIQKGTYGKCEKCGKQIEIGRLLAMPTASLCVADSKQKATKK